jgi:hypothetical protein
MFLKSASRTRRASKYVSRGGPVFTRLARPHVNLGRPCFVAKTLARSLACLSFPLGKACISETNW